MSEWWVRLKSLDLNRPFWNQFPCPPSIIAFSVHISPTFWRHQTLRICNSSWFYIKRWSWGAGPKTSQSRSCWPLKCWWSGGFCDPKSGACSCLAGWRGALCDDPCPPGTHGANCTSSCQVDIVKIISTNMVMMTMTIVFQCQNQGNCHPVTGNCHCPMGWTVGLILI